MKYKVITDYSIAEDSLDHTNPRGAFRVDGGPVDKWHSPEQNLYVKEVKKYLKNKGISKPSFLDLGCGSGVLVSDAISLGFDAVGIDGTDSAYKSGIGVWDRYKDKRLFNADISRNMTIYRNDNIAKFDIINCWEVLEHIYPERIYKVIENASKHAKKGAIFAFSISPFKTRNKPNLHMSWMIKEQSRWKEVIEDFDFKFIGDIKGKNNSFYHYIFENRYRGNVKPKNRRTFWSTAIKI